MKEKKCSRCEETKPIECFYKKSGRKNQWQSYCKPCHLESCNKSRKANPNTKKRTAKNNREWFEKEGNRKRRYEINKRYMMKRMKKDPAFKLRCTMGARILNAIKNNSGVKEGSVWKYLPYTPKQLKEHIEKQFTGDMSWDTHGNGQGMWNLDHIYPHSKLPYDSLEHPNFQKAWALDNLRPLPWKENLKKSDKIIKNT